MPNTKVLRRKIEAQITILQEQLAAIDLVDKLAQAHDNGVTQTGNNGDGNGVAASIQHVCGEVLSDEWHTAKDYLVAVRETIPAASEGAVKTALRRLVERKEAEVKGSKKEGLEYRRKKKEDATEDQMVAP